MDNMPIGGKKGTSVRDTIEFVFYSKTCNLNNSELCLNK